MVVLGTAITGYIGTGLKLYFVTHVLYLLTILLIGIVGISTETRRGILFVAAFVVPVSMFFVPTAIIVYNSGQIGTETFFRDDINCSGVRLPNGAVAPVRLVPLSLLPRRGYCERQLWQSPITLIHDWTKSSKRIQ